MKEYLNSIVYKNSLVNKIICGIISLIIFLYVDIIDLPSLYIDRYGISFLAVDAFLLLLIVFLLVKKSGVFSLAKIKASNALDEWLFTIVVLCVIGMCIVLIQGLTYKFAAVSILLVIDVAIIAIRIRIINSKDTIVIENGGVFSLEEICSLDDNGLYDVVLLNDEASETDLFNREKAINHLVQSIISCKNAGTSFVIGLNGGWGSGKTTILNNVKKALAKESDINVICDFEPWVYESEIAILRDMVRLVLKDAGVKYNSSFEDILRDVISVAFKALTKTGIDFKYDLLHTNNSSEAVMRLKNELEKYITASKKTYVFYLDNLDRMSADSILTLIRIISTILDIKGIIYVVAYDKKRISNIFNDTLSIEPKYLEKIVNEEVSLIDINAKTFMDIIHRSTNTVLKMYGVAEDHLSHFSFIVDYLGKDNSDIRKYKLIINSAFSMAFLDDELYKPDLLALEIVRFVDSDLYKSIKENGQYYISVDTFFSEKVALARANKDSFNKNAKDYFDDLIAENQERKDLLTMLAFVFPCVDDYLKNKVLISDNSYSDTSERYADINLNERVASTKFFDLYFNYSMNEFVALGKIYKEYLIYVKNCTINEDIVKYTADVILQLPSDFQKEFAEKLWMEKDNFGLDVTKKLVYAFYSLIEYIDDTPQFFALSPRGRIMGTIATFLNKFDDCGLNEFLDTIKLDYNKIYVINYIIEWFKDNESENIKKIKCLLENMINTICNEKINLYKDYYAKGNIWVLKKVLDEEKFNDYVRYIINDNGYLLYRMISDTITFSIDTHGKYFYCISKDAFSKLFDNFTFVKDKIAKEEPRCKLDYQVKEIFDLFDGQNEGNAVEDSYMLDYPIDFNDLS